MRLKYRIGIIIYTSLIFIFLVLLGLEINYGFNSVNSKGVSYNEKSDISYKVYLKKNDYYDKPYLDENSSYIASLIDNFNLDFRYINTFSDDVDYSLKYGVTAKLEVYDSDNTLKPIYTKDYILSKEKEITGKGKMAKVDLINQVVNYDEYNRIVLSLKKEIIPTANLIINFNTSLVGKNAKLEKDILSNHTSTLSIPISQRTINIDLTKNNFNNKKTVSEDKKISHGLLIIIFSTIFALVVISISFVIYITRNTKRISKYEQKVRKVLREYDRAITEAKGKLIIPDEANTIEVKDFEELLDVHDNLNVPIIYYRISNVKSIFLVKSGEDIYYNVIKEDDFI